MPAQTYADPAFYELEVDRILRKDWHAIARVEQVPGRGDFITVDLLGEPLVVVRGTDEAVRVLSRVCRHRYADVTADRSGMVPACGTIERFECPYHMWTYRLDGSLLNAVDMQRRSEFDPALYSLPEVRSEIWQGFIFVNLDAETTIPLGMEPVDHFLGQYDLSDWRVVSSKDWGELDAGWKPVVENAMEFYHHLGAHQHTLEEMLPGLTAEVGDGAAGVHLYTCRMPVSAAAAEGEEDGHLIAPVSLPPAPGLDGYHRGGTLLVTRFPMTVFAARADWSTWLQVLPTSVGTHRLIMHRLAHISNLPEGITEELADLSQQYIDPVQAEDSAVNGRVQANMSSAWATGGVLHDQEFPVLHLQRYLAFMLSRGSDG
ncbi:aromatic ring-hydroxylating oxygenase subunit alpha [Nocardioides alcanivorans]|uniref:aromatic ring-hydroxylating oxygenase subunit alpha n=1 Tax=Nocardioides alcanivorans TaxID=2897352 RepID=UPI001F2ED854|nr:aromatic ring-hydroxylating dioxygenase subunit alpha [Nocardioides alcanivorans]